MMTVTLNLEPEVEAEIAQRAAAQNTTTPAYLEQLLRDTVKPETPHIYSQEQLAKNQAALAMLEEWDREDKTDDPEELVRREAEWQEFKKGMNENSLSGRIIYQAQDYP